MTRTLFESKSKVLYKLTQKGIDLLPLMLEINLWANKYFMLPADSKAILDEVKNNKEGFIKKSVADMQEHIIRLIYM